MLHRFNRTRVPAFFYNKTLLICLALSLLVAGCATGSRPSGTSSAESPGSTSAKTGSTVVRSASGVTVYHNPTVGLALDFSSGWVVWARAADMRPDFRSSIEALEQDGQEVLAAGHLNNIVGFRLTTENVGIPVEDYATVIIDINKSEVNVLSKNVSQVAGQTMVIWEAAHPSTGLEFVEYVAARRSYNLRLTFWTHPSLRERYTPEFRRVAESMRAL